MSDIRLGDQTGDYQEAETEAAEAFEVLRERIKHPEKETWKKAIFTLYPDGKFDMDLGYERPPSTQSLTIHKNAKSVPITERSFCLSTTVLMKSYSELSKVY